MWVMTIEPLAFPGCSMAGKGWWERSLLGFPASLARHVKSGEHCSREQWSLEVCKAGVWGLHRKLLLTFSLGDKVLGKRL